MKKVRISIFLLILLLINQIGYAQTFEDNANSYLNTLVKQGKFSGTSSLVIFLNPSQRVC